MAEWGKRDKFVLMCTLALALISRLYAPGRIHIPPSMASMCLGFVTFQSMQHKSLLDRL